MPSHLPPDFAATHFLSEDNLSLDLLNSEHFDYRGKRPPQDLLEDAGWLGAWVRRWQLPVTPPPDALALTALRALRALLRGMATKLAAKQPITGEQWEELNALLALSPLYQQVVQDAAGVRLALRPLHPGWMSVVSQVAAAWVDLVAGTPSGRLKVCANPACRWVFLDQSHNQSRRWCRQWACGNLMNVRQHRALRSQGSGRKKDAPERS